LLGDRIDRHARRAVTKGAAAMEVAGAKPDEIGIVETRRFDSGGIRLHGVAHAEFEEALDDFPMTAACGDVVETGPGKEDGAPQKRGRACH